MELVDDHRTAWEQKGGTTKMAVIWLCDNCGAEYKTDVGRCPRCKQYRVQSFDARPTAGSHRQNELDRFVPWLGVLTLARVHPLPLKNWRALPDKAGCKAN